MLEPINQLAFAMHALPGGYALLLGSGISSAAGVPTGWSIVKSLATKLAALDGAQPTDAFAWFRERYGVDADYSTLLEHLGSTPAERQRILRGYLEPTEGDRENGVKVPGAAHKAIAELVQAKVVRVIVTTNFDQLLETAIRANGVVPQIVSSADGAEGCMPLAHAPCTIIKVNGDYLDTRIRNTVGELDSYDAPLAKLLTQVFDEYGLIVCGWSADWDTGLRALVRAAPRRFSTFWLQRGETTPVARELIEFRRAHVTAISGADEAFGQLAAKMQALRAFDNANPMSIALLVQELKQDLVNDSRRIRLADMVRREKDLAVAKIESDPFKGSLPMTEEVLRSATARYDAMCEPLVALLANGCFWASPMQEQLFVDVFRVIARNVSKPPPSAFNNQTYALKVYPAILCLYAAGISAVATGKFELLRALLDVEVNPLGGRPSKFIITDAFGERRHAKLLEGRHNRVVPFSEHMADRFRPVFADVLPDSGDFETYFDRFEYFVALQTVTESAPVGWAPMGRFGFEIITPLMGRSLNDIAMRASAEEEGANWPPLQAGLFGGTVQSHEKSVQQVINLTGELRMYR